MEKGICLICLYFVVCLQIYLQITIEHMIEPTFNERIFFLESINYVSKNIGFMYWLLGKIIINIIF
jgi:hypothetical protein